MKIIWIQCRHFEWMLVIHAFNLVLNYFIRRSEIITVAELINLELFCCWQLRVIFAIGLKFIFAAYFRDEMSTLCHRTVKSCFLCTGSCVWAGSFKLFCHDIQSVRVVCTVKKVGTTLKKQIKAVCSNS